MRQGNEANLRSSLSKAADVDSASDLGSTRQQCNSRAPCPPLPDLMVWAQSRSGAFARTTSRTSPSTFLDGRITVFTGVSGSGKSSLVFDTIAAESQRVLNETFPTFVQSFLPRYGQPNVDVLANLSKQHRRSATHGRKSALDIGNGDRHLRGCCASCFLVWGSQRFRTP